MIGGFLSEDLIVDKKMQGGGGGGGSETGGIGAFAQCTCMSPAANNCTKTVCSVRLCDKAMLCNLLYRIFCFYDSELQNSVLYK